MRYSIGSVSKQFTAVAVLMLVEEGKLSLDDKVARWLPDLTRADEVSIRQLLSMTSGYQDFWPQDYVMPMMLEPATPERILETWARKPLDFEPGTKWQYSNTNYVIAGRIVEKVSGMPILRFMTERIFLPLGMSTAVSSDATPLGEVDPLGYMRCALAPARPAPRSAPGWMFAAGELAMTPGDLAKWDLSVIEQSLLRPESYRAMLTEVRLANGIGTRYGLGVSLSMAEGRRKISHGGEVSGFTAHNEIYPDERAAVIVLANLDASDVTERVAARIGELLFAASDPGKERSLATVREVLEGLRRGTIDRTLFTPNAVAYFDESALRDFAASLGPLRSPKELAQLSRSLRGGMTVRRYRAQFKKRTLRISTFWTPDGKLEQFLVSPAD
jgi:CubicO group peptidase (beta-lactamase class C family)